MDIGQRITDAAQAELEKIYDMKKADVGNRPLSPVTVISNNLTAESGLEDILREKMRRIWRQSEKYIWTAPYKTDTSGALSILDDSGSPMSEFQIRDKIDAGKTGNSAFSDMTVNNIYNIIDTSAADDTEDFINAYNCIDTLKQVFIGKCRTMAIIILDDSSNRHSLALKITDYLAEHNIYDGTVIISNRDYSGCFYTFRELYKIAASVIILSDNDSVLYDASSDSARFLSCLYNGNVNTVSYLIEQRPNRDIAVQMIDTYIKYIKNALETKEKPSVGEWGRRLGVSDRISACEEVLRHADFDIDMDFMEHMPMRNGDDAMLLDLESISCREFMKHTFPDVFEKIAKQAFSRSHNSERQHEILKRFRDRIKENSDAWDLISLTDEKTDAVLSSLSPGEVNENLPVRDYMEQLLDANFKKDVIYPACRDMLYKMRSIAQQTVKDFGTLAEEYPYNIPIGGFKDLGSMYVNICESYMHTDAGRRDISLLASAGNSFEEFSQGLLRILKNTVKENMNVFSLPFAREWSGRLGLLGDAIYKVIHSTLDEDIKNNRVHLKGYFPLENKLSVYFLHTKDPQTGTSTGLYEHLKNAYAGENNVCFFNTGLDDSIEALKIFSLSDDRLRMTGE